MPCVSDDAQRAIVSDTITTVRLPNAWLRRAEALARELRNAPEFAPFRMSKSAVLRLALLAGLERLEERYRSRARTSDARSLTFKVSPKGGVSVYGLGKWPTTLYRDQWSRLLDVAEELRAFITAHAKELV
jgi:hypothetical protein